MEAYKQVIRQIFKTTDADFISVAKYVAEHYPEVFMEAVGRGTNAVVSKAEELANLLPMAYHHSIKVETIRLLRQVTGCSLYAAKYAVDMVVHMQTSIPPSETCHEILNIMLQAAKIKGWHQAKGR
jgi:ribosomal protein L7/L12